MLNVAGAKFNPPRSSLVNVAVGLKRHDSDPNFTSSSLKAAGTGEYVWTTSGRST